MLTKFKLLSVGLLGLCFLLETPGSAQNTVTIGSEALNDKAVLTLMTPTGDQGFILPIVENKENINPSPSEKGMLVFENENSRVYLWDGASWLDITTAAGGATSALNDLTDVNAASPTEGQVLQFQQGVGWVASDLLLEDTDNQSLLFAGEILTIEGGEGSIDLNVYRQNISFNEETNELSITDGNTIILPSEDDDADPTNELQDISLSGTEISITDGSTIDLAPIIPTGGSDDQTAAEVVYDNVTSGLAATNVQDALDELESTGAGGTLWSQNADDLYFDTGNIGIGTDIPEGRLDIVSNDQQRALTLTQNYADGLNAYGNYMVMGGTGSGDKYGNYTQLQSGDGHKYGNRTIISHQANETSYAFNAETYNDGLGSAYGLRVALLGSGTNYGVYSEGEDYNYLSGKLRIGVATEETDKKVNVFAAEETYALNIYSNYSGSSTAYGNYTNVFGPSSGEKYGSFMRVEEGTGTKYGAKVLVTQAADANSYGFRTEMLNSSAGSSYGFYNEMVGSGTKYGIYSEGEDFNYLSGRTAVGAPMDEDKRLSVYTTSEPYAVSIVQDYSSGPSYGLHVSSEDHNYLSGTLGIGTEVPASTLDVRGGNWNIETNEGDFRIGDDTYRLKIGVAIGGGGAGDTRIRAVGGTNRMMLGGGNNTVLTVNDQDVGIGTTTPLAKLEVSTDSSIPQPQLLLSEEGSDYARLTFQNSASSNFWTIAGFSHNSDPTSDRLNIYNSVNGDLLSISGGGQVAIGGIPSSITKLTVRSTDDRIGVRTLQNYVGNETSYGYYLSANGTGSGAKYGVFTTMAQGSGVKFGNYTTVNQAADAFSYGHRINITNDGASSSFAVQGFSDGSGSGTKFGVYMAGEDANYFSGRVNVNNTLSVSGEINRPSTGNADMVPLAYGFVTAGGTIGNGSGNWSVIRVSEGVYNITITDETFAASTHIAIVSKIGATGGIGWDSSSGNLRVTSVNSSNVASDVNFSFVVYKP